MKNVVLLFLVLFGLSTVFGQTDAIRWYTIDHGLPQNSVKDIVKDKYGFLWLSTEDGICRFDGTTFLEFDDLSLSSTRMGLISGNVFSDSLFIANETTDERLLIHQRQSKKQVDYKATIRFQNQEFRELINSSSITTTNYPKRAFVKTKEGVFLIKNDTVWFLNPHKKELQNLNTRGLKSISFFARVIDGQFYYINANLKNILRFSPDGLKTVKTEKDFFAKSRKIFWSSTTKQAFLIQNDAIYQLNASKNSITKKLLFTFDGLENLNILTILYDEVYQKLYLGSATKGLAVISRKDFNVVKSFANPNDANYYAHIPIASNSVLTPDGQLLQSKGLLADFNLQQFKAFNVKRQMILGENQTYWILANSNFFKYQFFSDKPPALIDLVYGSNKFFRIFDLGTHFAATGDLPSLVTLNNKSGHCLFLYKGKSFKNPSEVYPFRYLPSAVAKLSDEQYLVGTRKGLYQLNRKSKKTTFLKGTEHLAIKNIKITARGHVFVLTKGQGLFLLKQGKLIPIDTRNFSTLLNPHCILEDTAHNLWISTNKGLFKIPEDEILRYGQNKLNPIYYYVYTKENGFNINEFNGDCDPCGTQLANGAFTFPSLDGLVFFKPQEVPAYYPTDDLHAERVQIDGKKAVFFKDVIQLENNFYRAIIHPDIPYYSDFQNLKIEALLKGKNNTWENVDRNNGYSLTQLEYGSYELTFRVLSSPNATFIYKKITIEVQPLYYQTIYFKVLLLLLLILSLLLIHKLRIRYWQRINKKLGFLVNEKTQSLQESLIEIEEIKNQLQKETRMQKKLLGTISHDIATPLKYINIIATKLSKLSDQEIEKSRDLLLSMQYSTAELFMFTSTLQSYANLYNENQEKAFETFDLHDLIEKKIALFNEFARSKSIVITNMVAHGTAINSNRNVLQIAMHNIIDNAVKYTESGSISITFEKTAHNFILKISDTGTGMDANVVEYYETLQMSDDPDKLSLQKFGIGLHMVIQLLPIVNGKLYFLKNQPKGTIVKLEILL